MAGYSRNDVVLVSYPFSLPVGSKVRPAVIVSAPHSSRDVFIVPLTSHAPSMPGEYRLKDWSSEGLNVPTSVKRGIFTLHESLILKSIGVLTSHDADQLDVSLRDWLGLA